MVERGMAYTADGILYDILHGREPKDPSNALGQIRRELRRRPNLCQNNANPKP